MNWLDIVLLAVLGLSLVAGIIKGFARAVMGTAMLALGLFCGLWFYRMAGDPLREYTSSPELANLIGFFAIFVAFVILGGVLGILIDRAIKAAKLSGANRVAGGAFGLLRGVFVATIIVMAAMAFASKVPPRSVANSRVAPYVVGAARGIVAAAPREVKDGFHNSYQRLKEAWSHGLPHRDRLAGQSL